MPRQRTPERDQAFAIFHEHNGKIANREIAKRLGIPEKSVGAWKAKDSWVNRLYGSSDASTKPTSGNRKTKPRAVDSVSKADGNDKPDRTGFFRRIFPNDEDTRDILSAIEAFDPLEILWQNIVIQYAAIARAQRIMFVQDRDDHSELTSQPAWDKHASFLQAQSRAMKVLEGLIARYEGSLPNSLETEEKRMRIEKLKAEITKLQGPDDDEAEDDGFLEALKGRGSELWADAMAEDTDSERS